MTDKRQKATKVKSKCDKPTIHGIYSSLEKKKRVLLELVRRRTQNITIIDQEKHKIEKIYIWNLITTELIMKTLI